MFKLIGIVLALGFITSGFSYADEEVKVTKIKRATVIKRLRENFDNNSHYAKLELVNTVEQMTEVLDDLSDELEHEAIPYDRNRIKDEFKHGLAIREISVAAGERAITNAWGSGGRTYTVFRSILCKEASCYEDFVKFSIKLYDAYIKNGYTQVDALNAMEKAYEKFVEEERANIEKEKVKKEKSKKSTRRNVPSTWRSYR